MVLCLCAPGAAIPVLAEACLRFTPKIAMREGEAIFLNDLDRGAAARVRALALRFGAAPEGIRLAWGVSAAQALARARHPDPPPPSPLPVEALVEYASPFCPLSTDPETWGRIRALAATLRALGVTTLSDFAALPPSQVAMRFGAEGLRLAERVRADLAPEALPSPPAARVGAPAEASTAPRGRIADLEPWPRFLPPERLVEETDLADPETLTGCASLEGVLFGLRAAASRLLARLRGRALRISVATLGFELDGGGRRELRVELPVPQGSVAGLLPLLRERMEADLASNGSRDQGGRIGAPVSRVRIEAIETAPGRGAQTRLFDRELEEEEAMDALLGRLRARFARARSGTGGATYAPTGNDRPAGRAFFARAADRHLPEGAWSPDSPGSAAGGAREGTAARIGAGATSRLTDPSAPARPTRLLRDPIALTQLPGGLVAQGRLWRPRAWIGPERLSGEWWWKEFHRDYYRVATETGDLWIFLAPEGAFLHGFFD